MDGAAIEGCDYVAGHWSAKGLDILEGWLSVTLLRNPIDRLVSHYNYCHQHGDDDHPDHAAFVKRVDFIEWAASPYCIDNFHTRYLCDKVVDNLDWALKSLSRIDVVGILNHVQWGMDYVMRTVSKRLQRLPNMVGHDRKSTYYILPSEISPKLHQELWERNRKDRQLIVKALER
jgi:hypothetical protein